MTSIVRAVAAAAALAASIAAPASAAWTAPETLSQPHFRFDLTAVGYTAGGTVVASWGWDEDGAAGSAMATRAPAASGFGAELALPANIVSGPRPYASGRLVVATRTVRGNPTEGIEASTLRVRFGGLDGVFGSSHVIASRSHSIERPDLVVNRSGDAALAWWEGRGTPPTIYVSLRRRGGSFGAPIKIGQRGVSLTDHSVAIGENGDVLVAWEAAGRIRTRMKLHAEGRFRSLDEVRSETATSSLLRTAVAENGRAWVAWGAQRLGDGGPIGDGRVQVARRPAGASRFDPARLLERSDDLPSAPSLAINKGGTVALAWTATRNGSNTVDAAIVTSAAAPPITELARAAVFEGQGTAVAALADSGAATVAWTQFRDATPDADRQVFAAVSSAAGAWGEAELVSDGPASTLTATYAPGGTVPTVLFDTFRAATSDRVVQAASYVAP